MPTFTAFTQVSGLASGEKLGQALERLTPEPTGVGVFEIEDGSGLWEVGGYFPSEPDQAGLSLLAAVFAAPPFVVSELPETDWVAHVKRELSPVKAGRFFVYGGHDADKVPDTCVPLLIEAAMAFGTGHHGTTLGCLRAFDSLLDAGALPENVIDIGCGTAVLAMAAARTLTGNILASDIDEVAVDVAKANIVANGLEGRITCLEATGLDDTVIQQTAPFDLVFANILKGPLIDMAPMIAAATQPGGHLILSGILNEQADDVRRVYRDCGYNQAAHIKIVDWSTLLLVKNRS